MTEPKKRGPRPIKGETMSDAEYRRRYRAKRKAQSKEIYFALPNETVAELSDFAEKYGIARNKLLAVMIEGNLNALRSTEPLLSHISDQEERVDVIRSQILQLMQLGRPIEAALLNAASESLDRVEGHVNDQGKNSNE